MIVLVTMRMVESAGYRETRDAISHDWARLFAKYGISAILVPNAVDDPLIYFDLNPAGVLLTGGDDLGTHDTPTMRDRIENRLLLGALDRKVPIFGVCRGLQIVNRHFGGRLEQNLPEPHVGEHDVRLLNGGSARINSFHNQGVLLNGVAPNLNVFASTDGGVVEGIRHETLPVTAVQWHPERPSPAESLDNQLLSEWLAQCA